MHLHPTVAALFTAAFFLGLLPTVAVGLTLDPVDHVADHVPHDARLAAAAATWERPQLPAGGDDEDETEAEADERVFHEIEAGESLATIAERYGLDGIDDWRLLFDANPDIEHPDLVEPGTVIRIPAPDEELERRDLPTPVRQAARTGGAGGGDVWWRLALCESGGRNVVSSNGLYYGYFQFLPATWHSVGGSGLPTDHSYAEQVSRARILQSRAGWGQWPACARALGLR